VQQYTQQAQQTPISLSCQSPAKLEGQATQKLPLLLQATLLQGLCSQHMQQHEVLGQAQDSHQQDNRTSTWPHKDQQQLLHQLAQATLPMLLASQVLVGSAVVVAVAQQLHQLEQQQAPNLQQLAADREMGRMGKQNLQQLQQQPQQQQPCCLPALQQRQQQSPTAMQNSRRQSSPPFKQSMPSMQAAAVVAAAAAQIAGKGAGASQPQQPKWDSKGCHYTPCCPSLITH
jgi:hypothetical protein